jgi:hypothetical protein
MTVPFYNTKTLGGRTDAGWFRSPEVKALPPPRYGPGAFAPAQYEPAAGPAGVDQLDGAQLELAMAAGMAALQAGYGGVLPDGQAPCGHCPSCTYRHPEGCRQPRQKALAQLDALQAQAARIDQADADAVMMQRVIYAEQARRGIAL